MASKHGDTEAKFVEGGEEHRTIFPHYLPPDDVNFENIQTSPHRVLADRMTKS